MSSNHSIDDGDANKQPSVNAEHGTNNSDGSYTVIVDSVVYDDLMAEYLMEDDEVGGGLSHLHECYMASTQDGDCVGGGTDEYSETCTPPAGYNNVEVPYETSQQIQNGFSTSLRVGL